MKLQIKQLKQLVNFDLSPNELADLIHLHMTEIEGVDLLPGVSGIIVAKITAIRPHPNADKLQLATVEVGGGKTLEVVCGAKNIAVGQIVPLAQVGAKLPGGEINAAEIRGVKSLGMLCAGDELGISDDHSGILILPDNAKLGDDATKYVKTDPDNAVIDIKVLSNRPDYLSYIGVAKEIALLLGKKMREVKMPSVRTTTISTDKLVTVKVANHTDCPRYAMQVMEDVIVSESPKWLKDVLIASDIQPVSNVVDVMNYVMLITGQPLHAFDLDKISGSTITVRRARKGETLSALNHKTYELDNDHLIVADNNGPVALAGVIGGMDSAVWPTTTRIAVESANFDMAVVRMGARRLGLRTDAMTRYEKGLDPNSVKDALQMAVGMIQELTRASASAKPIDVYHRLPENRKFSFAKSELDALIGLDIPVAIVIKILQGLGFGAQVSSKTVKVTVPTYRNDIKEVCDIAEEIVRLYGIDKIPTNFDNLPLIVQEPLPSFGFQRRVANVMAGAGFNQVVISSLVSEDEALAFGELIGLKNALTIDGAYLQTSLIPGLAREAENLLDKVQVFEIARVFQASGQRLPNESYRLGVLTNDSDKKMAYRKVKGVIEELAERLINQPLRFVMRDVTNVSNYAEILCDNTRLGIIGLHKGMPVAEIDLDELMKMSADKGATKFVSATKYPSITFDINVELTEKELAGDLVQKLQEAHPLLESVQPIDEYDLGNGKRRVTLSFTLRASDRTLTEADRKEVEELIESRIK